MNCNMIQPASITFTPTLGSTVSPFNGIVNITQRLCYPCCVESTPVFQPQFSVRNITNVGKGMYVFTLHVEGSISYVSTGGSCGCCKQQPLKADVVISVASDDVPVIDIATEPSINALSAPACQMSSRTFVCDTPISISVTTAQTTNG